MSATMGVKIDLTKQSFECLFDYAILPAGRQTSVAATICLHAIRQTAITAVVCLQQELGRRGNTQGVWNAGYTQQARLNMAISTNDSGIAVDLRTGGTTPAQGSPRTLQRPKSSRSRESINTTKEVKRIEEFHSKRSYAERTKPGRSAPRVTQRRPIAGSPVKCARDRRS